MIGEETIFGEAASLPPTQRSAYLDRQCGENAAMRARIEALLAGADEAGGFLANPLSARAAWAAEEKPGDTIGRYTLIEKLGAGGCGVVWLAEQRAPVRRRVALKVIKLGMGTKEVIGRFEAERQALALMDHPNIAKVFDAGTTGTGRPFFVMELVRGVPITRYCDEARLSTEARLKLFIDVCHAIQHAHQKGIIHRDVKPSNILVAQHDDTAIPKVIDFGIAKATQGRLTDNTIYTAFAQFIGTPAYMSPEQAEFNALDVDTRSDIYSLGVLLYELLTGRPPFDPKTLAQTGLDEIRRIIREVEPPRPSTRLATLAHPERDTLARQRGVAPAQLATITRGDLDWIVMKALEKNRTRRYESASAFAADVQRHLAHEPIVARPPSGVYTLQKLIRRHRVAFCAFASVLAVLIVGAVVSTWQAVRASRAEEVARRGEKEQSRLRAVESAQRQRAENSERAALRRAYAADMNLAQQALAADNLGRARELLDRHRPKPGEPDLRGWEWRYVWQQARSDPATVLTRMPGNVASLAVSHDRRWVALTSVPAPNAPAAAQIWDTHSGAEIQLPATTRFSWPVFSPFGPFLALAVGPPPRIQLWNISTRQLVHEWPRPAGTLCAVGFSADGAELVTAAWGGPGNTLRWMRCGVADGRPVVLAQGAFEFEWTNSVALSRDARRAAVLEERGFISVVDLDAGRKLWTLPSEVAGGTGICAISPDGNLVVSAGHDAKSVLLLWDGATGQRVGALRGHQGPVFALTFSRDGKTLVSGGADQTIRIWSVDEQKLVRTLRGHERPVTRVAFSTGDATLISGARGGVVNVWDLRQPPAFPTRFAVSERVRQWRFSEDGASVFVFEQPGQVTRWSGRDFGTRETVMQLGPGLSLRPPLIAFAMDAPRVAVGTNSGGIRVWDWERQALVHELGPTAPLFLPKVFLERGRKLLVWAGEPMRNGAICEWDVDRGILTRTWPVERAGWFVNEPDIGGFDALSADEKELFLLDALGSLTRIDLNSGRLAASRLVVASPWGLMLSPDGSTLIAPSLFNNCANVWNARTLQPVIVLPAYLSNVGGVAFSPDSRRLVTMGSGAEGLRIWDVENWEPVLTLPTPSFLGVGSAFSRDGNSFGARGEDQRLHLWRAPSWGEIDAAEKEGRWR